MHILIVEDSRTQAEILKHILEKNGFETAIAENGKKALEHIAGNRPALIISDVIMPVMNGYELCKILKKDEQYRNIPLILLTALSDTRDVALALQAGADNFITKPYQREYIIQRVKKILASPGEHTGTENEVAPVHFSHGGQVYQIALDRPKILDFLLSAYEAAVIQHLEFQRAQKELRTTNEKLSHLNQIISIGNSSLKPDDLLNSILQKTMEMVGFDMGALYLLNADKTGADLQYYHESGEVSTDFRVLMGTLNVNEGSFQELFIHGVPQFISLTDESSRIDRESIILKELGVKYYALLPLTSASNVIGAIALISHHRHDFSSQEKAILSSIGTEIGNTVQKTLLLKRLELANDETNLYLDIMTHDINNVNTGALGYLEMLAQNLEGENKRFADIILQSINQTIEIIGNVSTIRKMHERKAALKPVQLDDVIRNEILHFSSIIIHYAGTDVVVAADNLVGQIFTNLIGNSAKFAGDAAEITISVEEQDDEVLVAVVDNGPGIPDDMKPQVFDRFRKGGSKKSGKGLGLFIARHLVEGYGGRIWAEDRVAGHQNQGAAIHFTLKKAN